MKTKVIKTNHPQAISRAHKVIQKGGVIAFPTDTVYGVGSSAFNSQAVEKLYEIKKREREKAIPILLAERAGLDNLVSEIPLKAQILMDRFWPGPLTLILPKNPGLPTVLSPGSTVGVRIPANPFTRDLLKTTGPLATTSANISGLESSHTAADVMGQLGGKISLLLDGGQTPGKQGSTIVDCSKEKLHILRRGPILEDEILAAIAGT